MIMIHIDSNDTQCSLLPRISLPHHLGTSLHCHNHNAATIRSHAEGVQCLLYLSDVDASGGPTMGVWDDGAIPEDAWQRDYRTRSTIRGTEPESVRTAALAAGADVRPDLYARERPLRGRVGRAVFYRYELWHRGSAMKPAGLRVMHSFQFRRADCPWLGGVANGFGLECSRMPREWIAGLTVAQRTVVSSGNGPCLSLPFFGVLLPFPFLC